MRARRGVVESDGDTQRVEQGLPATYEFDGDRFADPTTPTLLLVGNESPLWARAATNALVDALPNGRIAVL